MNGVEKVLCDWEILVKEIQNETTREWKRGAYTERSESYLLQKVTWGQKTKQNLTVGTYRQP